MLLMEPSTSPYDWNFRLFGIDVRVSWLFWVMAFVWGYETCNSFDLMAKVERIDTPGVAVLIILWMASMFLSVLVHEMGHAFAYRYFGIDSYIVLYHLGGLAIAQGAWGAARRRTSVGHGGQIFISAAGPAAQLLLSLAMTSFAIWMSIPTHTFLEDWMRKAMGIAPTNPGANFNVAVYTVVYFFAWFNLWWALINLVPILPLDGGRIAQSIFGIFRRDTGDQLAVWLSIICGFGIGIWAFNNGQRFLGIMFVFLAISNIQTLQSGGGSRRPW